MFNEIYRCKFDGLGIGRVERDRDFAANLGFYHNEYQIQYIFDGERYFFKDGICFRMGRGCLAIIDKNMIAKTCIIGGHYHDRLLIEMEEAYFKRLSSSLGFDLERFFDKHHGVYQKDAKGMIPSFVSLVDSEMRAPSDGTEMRIKLAILNLFADAASWEDSRMEHQNTSWGRASGEKQKRVHQVVDYISAHFTEISSLDELAGHFYMSKSYLCRIFQEVTNFTITEYINLMRVSAGRQYLLNEDLSVTEIANLLGYDSLTYFERVFKKFTSQTPLQLKKAMREHRSRP